ncbi:hypothetical protein FBULB1_9229 [Fusarium bulbicola]|nr:hypothetical protein FBULB1_9229 [Fusarium bulbicola]
MKTIFYVIDPDGDVELVLREPNSHQIIPEIHSDDSSTHSDLPDCCFDNPPVSGRYSVFNELYSKSTTAAGTQEDKEDHEPREVRMRISSKHLSFVSSTFRDDLLASSNKDAPVQCSACSSPPSRPFTSVYTIGWDALALAIVLDAIHGRHAEIPRVINLGLLARITTVFDHYKCQEVIHVFFDHWQRDIFRQDGFPTLLSKTALLWFLHGSVGTSKALLKSLLECFQSQPLSLNEKRLELIKQIKDCLEDVHNSLLQESGCVRGDRLCSSLTLGVLVHMIHQHEHAEPPFIAPFDRYSVSMVLKLVKECSEPMPRHGNPRHIEPCDGRIDPCSIRGRMTPVIQKVEAELYRMRPADFKD